MHVIINKCTDGDPPSRRGRGGHYLYSTHCYILGKINELTKITDSSKLFVLESPKKRKDKMMETEIGRVMSGKTNRKPLFTLGCMEVVCEHKNTEYQAEEVETNISEAMWCLDCGDELEVPEKDFDIELEGKWLS